MWMTSLGFQWLQRWDRETASLWSLGPQTGGRALLDIHGFPWISMEFHRHPWISIENVWISWISMEIYGHQWISMGIHYIHGYQEIQRYSCISMDFHGFPTEGGGGPTYNPSSGTRKGPRVQAAHIPRISRAYLPRPRPRIIAHPHRLLGAHLPPGCPWIPMDINGIHR